MSLSSSWMFDGADVLVKPPEREELNLRNPDDYIARINEISSPYERLRALFVSTFDIRADPTHEALWVRKFLILGGTLGFFSGAIVHSKDIHQDYIRQHNASVFDHKYVGNRHFWDTLAYRIIGRGSKYGLRAAILTTTAGFIGIGSIVYRNKLHLPDWIVGMTTLGALSRLWIGPRGMAAGAVIGLGTGLLGYGYFRSMEIMTGVSMSELEYLTHKQWLLSRQSLLNRNHLIREEVLMEYVQDGIRHDSEI